eukprot:6151254-Ditylum_brightwellii.AAC.1
MSGYVPIVETCFPVVVMRFSETALPAVRIDHSIGGNTDMTFVQEDVTLQIHSNKIVVVDATTCFEGDQIQ